MCKLIRRFAVIATLAFWQGGFTFYGAVVVPIGADVLGSHVTQAAVTRPVTNYLNIAGAIALPILAWDLAAVVDAVRWRLLLRWLIWGGLAISLAALAWLHLRLDAMLDNSESAGSFRSEHQIYLIISTAQWAGALAALALSLWAWRAEDRKPLAA